MKERPILFNADMVRALLDGRKTQTRRIIKPKALEYIDAGCKLGECSPLDDERQDWGYVSEFCPYGTAGDRLWVKETWRPEIAHSCAMNTCDCADVFVRYAAGGAGKPFYDRDIPDDWLMPKAAAKGGVSPLFMPRWASRITLEVVSVRVERLQDISPSDCIEEGCAGGHGSIPGYGYSATEKEHFIDLWKSINGADSWDANPWVWVVEFKRAEAA